MENYFDINKANSFEEIVDIKRRAYQINKSSGIHIERILSGLYKNPTHFLFELLQNAEDAHADKVQITLDGTKLVFRHNGRPFDLRDIKGITGVDYSSKTDDITQIGRFGIGFKAVFGICEAPEIYSDNYNFRITNFYVPEKITEPFEGQKRGETYIVLPFKEEVKEAIYNQIEEALVDMDPDTVLFLRCIQQLDYLTLTKSGYYVRKKEKKEINGDKYYHCQIVGGQGIKSSYIFFEDNLSKNQNLQISIAYACDNEKQKLIEETDSTKLVVFFPTERDTFLKFKINGPYQTTPTRENIPETEENEQILEQTIKLYKRSLICLRDLGLMSVDFIDNLPITNRSYGYWGKADLFYDSFYQATVESFQGENLLPTNDNNYSSSEKCLLARGPVTDLLSKDDKVALFGKENWLSTEITRDRTNKLVSFLTATLKVKEIDYDVILSSISQDFLKAKNSDWFELLYTKGNSNISTVNKHLTIAFVLTESGDLVAPYIKDQLGNLTKNVYLPSKLTRDGGHIVNNAVLENKEVVAFFKTIGVTEMDIVESIRTQCLPKLIRCESEKDYFEWVQLLYLEIIEQPTSVQKDLKDLLSTSKCLAYLDENEQLVFTEPKNLFMAHGDAKILYGDCEKAHFLTEMVDNEALRNKDFSDFLKKIGVNTSIKLIGVKNGLTFEERKEIMQSASYTYYDDESVEIWEIASVLTNITKTKSKTLWNALNNINESYYTSEFKWWYYKNHGVKTYNSIFVRKLQKSAWLYNDDGECVCPSEIYEDDVRATYGGGICFRYFEFKPNAEKLLPAETQRKIELTRDIPIEVLEQMREQYVKLTGPEVVDISPEDTPIEIEEVELENPREKLSAEEITSTTTDSTVEKDESQDIKNLMDELYKDTNIPDTIIDQIVVKKVSNEAELDGDLGERFVVASLKKHYQDKGYTIYNDEKDGFTALQEEKYIEVIRHNKNGKIQKGYDITISNKEKILAYIEVKSKKGSDKEFFKVSGLQWEFAKKLNEEGNGDKHYVYVVTNVREPEKTKITSVKNPYKLWIEGKLEVDPVRIKY